jgi:prepilin-type N-terminal cleavage/methylation domain-containing protein
MYKGGLLKKQTGFTIVELLIVIVVIAILAAITVVAFNGIQDRSRLSAGLSFESQLRKKYFVEATGIWSFDECSGTTVKNNSDLVNTTDSITGTATWVTDTPSGQGCALRFNGTSTRIETAATLGSQYYVKAAWVRIAPTAPCVNIMSRAQTNGADAPFWFSGCRLAAGYQGVYTAVLGTQTLNDNKWHYVAVIWENGTLTLYTDGQKVAATSGTPAPTPAGGVVSIGSHSGANLFNGDIDNPFVAAQ